jgi:hypothetical protein
MISKCTFLILLSISLGHGFHLPVYISLSVTHRSQISKSMPVSLKGARPLCRPFKSRVLNCIMQSENDISVPSPTEKVESYDISIASKQNGFPNQVPWSQYTWFMMILPSMSNIFPYLIQSASSSTVPEEKRFFIILFLILKRVYLYAVALSSVDIAARRSVNLPSELGKRLQQLNEEIIGNSIPQSNENKEAARLFLALCCLREILSRDSEISSMSALCERAGSLFSNST